MVRIESEILIFFIALKDKSISPRAVITSHVWLAIFIFILSFYEKNDSENSFLQMQSEVFWAKK